MTLKEKFKNILIDWIDEYYNREHIAEVIEIDADDYAIEFANWLFNINKEVLAKQLKEFKKEKGL
jgi:hypothetical protein